MRSSGLLFIFWFLFTVVTIPFRWDDIGFYFVLSALLLLLNCFADAEPRELQYVKPDKPCPELAASFPSKILFQWFDSFVWLGFKRPLENKDLWSMKPEDTSTEVAPLFLKYWNQSVAKNSQIEPEPSAPTASFKKSSASVSFVNTKAKKPSSIVPALVKAFGGTFLFGSVLKLVNDLMTFVSPQILKLLINFVSEDEPMWKGYLYAGLLFGVASTQTLFLAQYFHKNRTHFGNFP
jgi:ATP-binding cassette, subfamily C (CFTR/MRP), member 1